MRVDRSFNNFARGKVDHDLMGRYDLPIYNSGSDLLENFTTNFKGNAIFRAGFEEMEKFQNCVMVEFKFNYQQQYICLFYASHVKFLSYANDGSFGFVQNTGADLDVSSPYTLAEAAVMSYSQNADVMYIAHPSHAPYKLTRTAADTFTLSTFSRTTDPFTGAGLYPSCVCFYRGRLYYAAPNNKITTVYASVAGSYDDFTDSPVTSSSAIIFKIAEISQKINWLFAGDNSLIAGASDGIVALNGGAVNTAITAATVQATLTSAPPCNSVYPLKKDGLIFYVGLDGRNIYHFKYNILNEAFEASDANILSYDITAGGMTKIRFKRDRNDLIFATAGSTDGSLLSCNFKGGAENIVGWHSHPTSGKFLDQAIITDNNGKPQLFTLTLRNSAYFIERQAEIVSFKERVHFFTGDDDESKADDEEAYTRYVGEQLKQCIFLDQATQFDQLKSNVITFDPNALTVAATSDVFSSGSVGRHIVYKTSTGYESGRFLITAYTNAKLVTVEVLQAPTANVYTDWYLTFSALSGLATDYGTTTVSVVADGGYLDDFTIAAGAIALNTEVTSCVIGYKYKGIIKSFCLGFQFRATETQITMKAISQFSVRCVASAGLSVGSSLYHLEPVQELSQNDINYLPPIPIDGTKAIQFSDDYQKDKFFYIVQDQPLPAIITSVVISAQYEMRP